MDFADEPLNAKQQIVLLVEDHPLFVRAMQDLIQHHYPGLQIVVAPSCESAAAWLSGITPQLPLRAIFCDLNLPDASGLQVLERLRPLTSCPLIVVTAEFDEVLAGLAKQLGANGFISKRNDAETMLASMSDALGPAMQAEHNAAGYVVQGLSQSQLRVAEQLMQGLSNKDIARALNIGSETVKSHISEVIARVGAKNRTDAVLKLLRGQA
jgi:DNA-binding NarL/FixJ family response regulator